MYDLQLWSHTYDCFEIGRTTSDTTGGAITYDLPSIALRSIARSVVVGHD